MILNLKENKEITMPMGKGTYGSKVGRPPKKKTKKKIKKKFFDSRSISQIIKKIKPFKMLQIAQWGFKNQS